mmetsp:Transcript_2070/g.4798  ORF Transcript_2070/g.4798 Transcript_2070/m.4798 type:complete len:247 (-) Transcript_2070:396-1136(-)
MPSYFHSMTIPLSYADMASSISSIPCIGCASMGQIGTNTSIVQSLFILSTPPSIRDIMIRLIFGHTSCVFWTKTMNSFMLGKSDDEGPDFSSSVDDLCTAIARAARTLFKLAPIRMFAIRSRTSILISTRLSHFRSRLWMIAIFAWFPSVSLKRCKQSDTSSTESRFDDDDDADTKNEFLFWKNDAATSPRSPNFLYAFESCILLNPWVVMRALDTAEPLTPTGFSVRPPNTRSNVVDNTFVFSRI